MASLRNSEGPKVAGVSTSTSTSRSVMITAFGIAVPPIAALATQPILARVLGPTGRGEVAAATAPLLLAVVILSLGMPEALTYYYAKIGSVRSSVLWTAGVLAFCLGAGGVLAVSLTSSLLAPGEPAVAKVMVLVATTIPLSLATGLLRGRASGLNQWKLVAAERVVSSLARLAGIGGLALFGELTVTSASLTIAITTFGGGVLYVVRRTNPRGVRSSEAQSSPWSFLKYASAIWLGGAAGVLYSRLDQVLLLPLAGAEELGLYAIAASISEVVLLFNLAVRDVLFTVESKSPDVQRLASAARVSTMVTLLTAVIFASFIPFFLPIVFGREFQGAVLPTLILIAAAVVGTPGSVAGAALSARGRPELRSASLIIGVVVDVLALLLLANPFGAIGAALATLMASAIAGNNLNIVWLRRSFGVPMRSFLGVRRSDLRALKQVLGRKA